MNQSQVTDLQVKIALDYNSDTVIKRIPNVQTYKELHAQARKVCNRSGVDKSTKIHFNYVDADNEKIGVEDDSDLQMAYALALSSDKKVKFNIELLDVKPTAPVEVVPEKIEEPKAVEPVIEEPKPIEEPVQEMPLAQEIEQIITSAQESPIIPKLDL